MNVFCETEKKSRNKKEELKSDNLHSWTQTRRFGRWMVNLLLSH